MRVSGRVVVSFVLVLASIAIVLQPRPALAAQITTRSLALETNGTTGGSTPDGVVNHHFTFTVPNVGDLNIGSIKFEYCTTASGTCTMPTGLDTTSATLSGTQVGATGFTIGTSSPANGAPYITRTAASVTAGTALQYTLVGVHNPTAANTTFYVRISTYTSTDRSGSPTDTGSVAASTANPIVLTGTMPESLIFCTGATITTVATVPDCSTATSGNINFNQLFSPTDTATATSQMAASTNATGGYSITVTGPNLTSGSNTIPGMASAGASVRGLSNFGLNLKANTTATSNPAVGAEIAAASNGTSLRGQAASGYNTVDTFKFVSGDSVANSANGGAGPTDAQIYTVSYIVNVSGSQASGSYTTTLTYVCTATF